MSTPRQKRVIRYVATACTLLLIGLGFWRYSVSNSLPELFEDLPLAEAPKTFPEAPYAKRFRWVKLNPEAFDRAFEVGGKLKLNFFGDEQYLTTIVGKQIHDKTSSTAAALLDDNPETMAIFSRSGKSLYAVFTLSDMRQVVVSHVGGRAYSIAEIDPASVGKCMPPPGVSKKKVAPKVSLRTGDGNAVEPVGAGANLEEIQGRLTPDQQMLLTRILSSPEAAAKLGRAFEAPLKPAERPPTDINITANPIAANLLMRDHRETAGTEIAAPFLAQVKGYSLYGRTSQGAKLDPGTASQVLYPRLGGTEYIDVLFLYTEAAQTTAGSVAQVQVRINALVAQLNAIFARSRIPMEIRAVNDGTQYANNRYVARSRYWEGSAATVLPEDYNTPLGSSIITLGAINPGNGLGIPRSTMDDLAFNNRTTHIPEGIGPAAPSIYSGAMRKPGWTELVSYGLSATGVAQSRPGGGASPYAFSGLTGWPGLSPGPGATPEIWFGRYVPTMSNYVSGGALNFALDWLLNTPQADAAAPANSWGMAGVNRSNSLLYGDQYWGLTTPWINHIHTNPWNDLFNLTAALYANNVAAPSQATLIAGYTWNLLPNTSAAVGPPLTYGVDLMDPGTVLTVRRAPVNVYASNPAGPVANTQWQDPSATPTVTNFLANGVNFLIGPAESTPYNLGAAPPGGRTFAFLTASLTSHPYRTVYDAGTIVADADNEYWNSDIFVGPTFDTRFYKQNVRGINAGYTIQIQDFNGPDTWGFVGNLRAPFRAVTGGQLGNATVADGWGADAYPYTGFTESGRNAGIWGERINNSATYARPYVTGFSFTRNPGNVFVVKANHGYVAGQRIFVVNSANATNTDLDGNQRILTATANWFTFANPTPAVLISGTFETGNTWLTVDTVIAHNQQSGSVVRICGATDATIGGAAGTLYEIERLSPTQFRVFNPTPANNATGTIPIGVDPLLVLHGTTALNTLTLAAATTGNRLAADSPSRSGVFFQRFLDNPANIGQYSGAVGLRMDTLSALGSQTTARYPLLHTETLIDEKADVICLLDTSGAANNFAGLSYQYERRNRSYNAVTNQNYIAGGHALHSYPSDGVAHTNTAACAVMWRDNRFAFVVDIAQASLNYSFGHEMGHILGCSHGFGDNGLMPDDNSVVFTTDVGTASTSSPLSPDTFTSMGVHIVGNDGNQYHTIMAYPRTATSLRIPYFSSPSLFFRGRQLSRSSDVLTFAGVSSPNCDNAQCIATIGAVVSQYRDANGTGRSTSTFVVGSIPGSGVLPRTNQPLPDIPQFVTGVSPTKTGMGTGVVPDASKAPTKTTAGVTAAGSSGTSTGTGTSGTSANPASSGRSVMVPVAITRPPNDNIAKAFMIQGASKTVRGDNKSATPETWEGPYSKSFQGKSVWWYWDGLTEGRVTIKTEGSNFDTVLLVFMYANGKFLPVAANDNAGNGISWSQVALNLRKGTRYYIGVDGAGGAEGQVVLNVEQTAAPATPSKVTVPTTSATRQKIRGTLTPTTGDSGQ